MKLLLLFLVCTASLTVSAQDCEQFKNGRFIYPNYPPGLSVRKGSKQKSYTNGVLQAVWKVKWLDDCTIHLVCKKVVGSEENFKKGMEIYSEITQTESGCFAFKAFKFVGEKREYYGQIGRMCLE